MDFDKIVIVTKETDFDRLTTRYSSISNASFALSSRGDDITQYRKSATTYASNVHRARLQIPNQLPSEVIGVGRVPLYPWCKGQIIVLCGPDGLFVNVAKFIQDQPVICINPDPDNVSGVIMMHDPEDLGELIDACLAGMVKYRPVTLGLATTNDGQSMLAVNDFLVGRLDPRSSRYKIKYNRRAEPQSSSGVLVTAPMGGTGWLKSCSNSNPFSGWDQNKLEFWVREPFVSVSTKNGIRSGHISRSFPLEISSMMPEGGVIFSDGMLEQCLEFNTGTTVSFSVADRKVNYVLGVGLQPIEVIRLDVEPMEVEPMNSLEQEMTYYAAPVCAAMSVDDLEVDDRTPPKPPKRNWILENKMLIICTLALLLWWLLTVFMK